MHIMMLPLLLRRVSMLYQSLKLIPCLSRVTKLYSSNFHTCKEVTLWRLAAF